MFTVFRLKNKKNGAVFIDEFRRFHLDKSVIVLCFMGSTLYKKKTNSCKKNAKSAITHHCKTEEGISETGVVSRY